MCREGFRNLRQIKHENKRGELYYNGKSEATERQRRERQMEETKAGRDRDNSVRVYRVYVLNTLQETEHTLRDDSESSPILPDYRLSPCCVCPSVCLKHCLSLFAGLCTVGTSVYLSFCLPESCSLLTICLFMNSHL